MLVANRGEIAIRIMRAAAELKRKSGDRVTLSATVNSAIPVKTLELIFNGEVIGVIENADEKLQLEIETDLRIEESSWAVVRTIGGDLSYQNWPFLGTTSIPLMAHSSPIYIDVDGKPRTDKSCPSQLLILIAAIAFRAFPV